jgi:hypothetical protein
LRSCCCWRSYCCWYASVVSVPVYFILPPFIVELSNCSSQSDKFSTIGLTEYRISAWISG